MTIWKLKQLLEHVKHNSAEIDGEWVPARPLGYKTFKNKLKAIWMVFTNKADVVVWEKGQ